MDATWRDERPLAITIASQNAARPVRSIVAISSALSSSSDFRMREIRVGSAAAGLGLAFFGARLAPVVLRVRLRPHAFHSTRSPYHGGIACTKASSIRVRALILVEL